MFRAPSVLASIPPIGGKKRDRDDGGDQCVFEHQIVEPMALERHVVAFHCSVPLAAGASNGFTIVVLASHSPPSATVLRVFGTKPRRSKKPRALSLASTLSSLVPRPAASLSKASHSMFPAPCPEAAGYT